MKLYCETHGIGPDLVLLHGWGMNAAVWTPLIEHLAADFRVTLIELPGHGGSEYNPTMDGLDQWTQSILDAAPEQAVWIGWSLGGQIAQRAAILAPERIQKLVLVASTPSFVQRDDWPHAMDVKTLSLFASSLLQNPHQTLERFLSLQVRGDESARETLRLLRQELVQRPEAIPIALEHGLDLLLNVDLRDELPEIKCPILWLLGERDTLIPVGVGEELEPLVPDADILILDGCAHAPFLSHTEQSLRSFSAFIGASHG